MEHFLHLKNVSFKYTGIGASDTEVLTDISLSLGKNECTAIVGPSGSGKTTLIQHFTGLLKPTGGHLYYIDQNIWSKTFRKSVLRKKIGLVFQFPETQLFEETVEKDVAFGPKNMGLSNDDVEQRVVEALDAVELDPELFRHRSPFRLSEGEKRRVAIAGVLAMQPDMLVFDEPTAGLDPKSVRRFISIIQRLQQQGKAIVVVTHSMDIVAETADRVIALHRGKLAFDGPPHALFTNPVALRDIGLEQPTLIDALQSWNKPVPSWLNDVISFQEFDLLLKKFAHSHEL